MAYDYPEYDWNQVSHYDRLQCCQLTKRHHHPIRRQSTSTRYSQQTPSHAPPSQLYYTRSQYFDNEEDIYEPHLRYGELEEETIPADHLLDDYYVDSAPIPPWQRLPRQSLRRLRLAGRPDHHYEDDVAYSLFHNKVNGVGRYFDPMTSSPLLHQSNRQSYTSPQIYNQHNRPTRKPYKTFIGNHPPRHSLDLGFADYSDDEGDEDIFDSNSHHRRRYHTTPAGKNTPRRRHSLQHLHHRRQHASTWINPPVTGFTPDHSPIRHHQQSVLQPMRHTDTQHPLSFYGQAPPNGRPMLPMPQPMIHTPSFLSYHPPPHPQLGYGIPTVPGIMSATGPTTAPGSSMPFNPMMMMPPSLADTQINNGMPQQTDAKIGVTTPAAAASPTSLSSDDIKSPQVLDNVNTSSLPATSSLSSSSSAPISSKHNANGENSLIPLVRSLSLGESQPLGTKPRRRSLFESLFSLDGFKLSRNNSTFSNSSNTTNDQHTSNSTSSLTTTATTLSSSSSMIPVHDLATHTLTRKQSLSLEKKIKALSQRSYIWCYQIKPMPGQQQQQESGCWVAMKPTNQIKLDPYICYYHPSAMVKGMRTDNLSTLVTLDKEPKLSGSFTVMPQAKIARVYPSMFSSANYVEVLIDCLPADGQFVVRSG